MIGEVIQRVVEARVQIATVKYWLKAVHWPLGIRSYEVDSAYHHLGEALSALERLTGDLYEKWEEE